MCLSKWERIAEQGSWGVSLPRDDSSLDRPGCVFLLLDEGSIKRPCEMMAGFFWHAKDALVSKLTSLKTQASVAFLSVSKIVRLQSKIVRECVSLLDGFNGDISDT